LDIRLILAASFSSTFTDKDQLCFVATPEAFAAIFGLRMMTHPET
jgi:hypothetical protein